MPDRALREDVVFGERDECAERLWSKPFDEHRRGVTVPLEDAMGHEPIGRAFRFALLGRLAVRPGFALRDDVGDEHVVVGTERIERLGEGDEVAGDQPRALMNQLIEGMLTVGAGFAPVDRTGIVRDGRDVERHVVCRCSPSSTAGDTRESV